MNIETIITAVILGLPLATVWFAYKKWQPMIEEDIRRRERSQVQKIQRK